MKIYRCQHCKFNVLVNKKAKGTKSAKYIMGHHYDTIHKILLPEDMTGYQYFYYLLTKKDHGSCVECKQPTTFNEIAMKYSRFCNNPLCKQKYKEERDRRMMNKYGKIHLLDDPEMQKKMQAGRKIAGIYNWSDGRTKLPYLSSYEEDFLRYLDTQLHWPAADIMAPSPHTYGYEYNGIQHYYMPDFFIPSMTMEIEIKDDGSAINISKESRDKDRIKDELMKSLSNMFNYIRIVNKNYTGFEELLKED
jgi:hypothetical protein